MPPEFALQEDALDADRHVVAVRGEIDLFTAPELKQKLTDAIEGGKSRIVVDLADTPPRDSTALGVLIGAVKRLRSRDGAPRTHRRGGRGALARRRPGDRRRWSEHRQDVRDNGSTPHLHGRDRA